jgi:ComF family protein
MNILKDILNFFYPRQCDVCGRLLGKEEKVLCSFCVVDIPRTNFHTKERNPVSEVFWGRVSIDHSSAFFYYFKGSGYQKLLHKLKYNGREDIGEFLGKLYASELVGSVFMEYDYVVPVPLHPKKEKLRGYNQSEKIANGFSFVSEIPVLNGVLVRHKNTSTQTRKGRFDRYLNMEDMFSLNGADKIKNQRILLIDDVITTGATLEACSHVLLNGGCQSLGVIGLGTA